MSTRVRTIEAWAVAVMLAVLALGLALAPLLLPQFARALSARYSVMQGAEALQLAEISRDFVVNGGSESEAALAAVMTRDAVTHLDDVRRVIGGAKLLTGVLFVLSGVWLAVCLAWKRFAVASAAFSRAAGLVGVFVVLAAGIALIDFDTFFAGFHSLFFAPGTWVFPSDSLLIRLFPEPFWTAAGIAWGALIVIVAVAYAVVARMLRSAAVRAEGSMGAETEI